MQLYVRKLNVQVIYTIADLNSLHKLNTSFIQVKFDNFGIMQFVKNTKLHKKHNFMNVLTFTTWIGKAA